MRIRTTYLRAVAACGVAGMSLAAQAASQGQLSRGELLYTTHCASCHTDDVHWRDRGLVTDLKSLDTQVRRWQNVSRARWREDDIEAVTQYLNAFYYNFPP